MLRRILIAILCLPMLVIPVLADNGVSSLVSAASVTNTGECQVSISVTMIALSAFGVINALAGSILHNLGAFAVLLNSSRILRADGDK